MEQASVEGLVLTGLSVAALIAGWKSAKWSAAASGLALQMERIKATLADERGSFSPLAERLEVRDFDGDLVETSDGWLWAGAKISPVPITGASVERINELNSSLNSVLAGAAEGARIQVIHEHRMDACEAANVLNGLAKTSTDPVWSTLLKTRARDVKRWAAQGHFESTNSYVFIGLRSEAKRTARLSPAHLFSPTPWIEMEESAYRRLAADVMSARETLIDYYSASGGAATSITAEEVRQIIYRRMNQGMAESLPAPPFDPEVSPREDLCATDVEVTKNGVLCWADGRFSQTISMRRQPKSVISTLLETITRNEKLNFDFDLAMHFTVGDWARWEKRLTTQREVVAGNIAAAERNDQLPDLTEVEKEAQLKSVLTEMITGDEKLGVCGFSLTAYAGDEETLRARVERLQVAMRRSEGMVPVYNRKRAGLIQFMSTLPCSPHKDLHLHPCMTKDASAYAALTGAPSGVPSSDATDVYQTVDNRPFYWRPDHRDFKSGMTAIFAGSGAGKSVILNRQRAGFLNEGMRGLTADVGKSCSRVVEASGGQMIDITDPLAARSLGFFRIRPQAGERYASDELTAEEKLPLDRLAALEEQLETLALNPRRLGDFLSPPVLKNLHTSIRLIYREAGERGHPVMDDLIRVCATQEGDAGRELAERLSIYDSSSPLGRFFNDRDASYLDLSSAYTAFDFSATTKDPRLMLIATLGLTSYLGRFLRMGRSVGKFFDVDELHLLTDHVPVRKAIDLAIRTARKSNCHCTVASQSPEDAVKPEFEGIRSSCEVWWISGMRPSIAAASFDIGPGVVDLIGKLKSGGHDYREWCLLYPEGQVAHLRVRLGALDGRLFMGASKGAEKYTAEEAERSITGQRPERLIRALRSSGVGDRREEVDDAEIQVRHLPPPPFLSTADW